AFDAVMYGNVSSRSQYASWGCRHIAHLPIFIDPASVPAYEEATSILSHARDNDIVLCCGITQWRKKRLAGLIDAFSDARVHGSGWKAGFISDEGKLDLYRRSKIGWNIHNSTGPINQRLLMLAGWGVMQICDNKTGLAKFYDLNREAVGFDTIPEAVELTRCYLEHDDERRAIAQAGYERFHREYHPSRVWQTISTQIKAWMDAPDAKKQAPITLHLPRNRGARAPWRSFKRITTLWLNKQRSSAEKKIQRMRYSKAVIDLDESIYIGRRTPYHPGSKPRNARLHPPNINPGNHSDEHHIEALGWAMTVLIGPAKNILVTGPGDEVFASVASADSSRTITTIDQLAQADSRTLAGCDLLVCLLQQGEALETMTELAAPAPRFLVVLHPVAPSPAACDDFHALLTKTYANVSLSFLPDPHVPWLEPMNGPAEISPIIADCRK
ncbi:MAG: glycosyltransferase family 1 protein, partial [Planctomycetes bacterium]|nr:glycosyltransferase family 1 protein [Planctomycetota bacterium]